MIPNRCGIFPYGVHHTPCKPIERWCHLKWRSTKFHEMPWNSVIFSFAIQEFSGIPGIFHGSPKEPDVNWNNNLDVPWNSMEHGNIWFGCNRVPQNSIGYSLEFHRTPCHVRWRPFSMELRSCRIKCDQVPWIAMELNDCWYLIWRHLICMEIMEHSS